jgi:hypothetical protein
VRLWWNVLLFFYSHSHKAWHIFTLCFNVLAYTSLPRTKYQESSARRILTCNQYLNYSTTVIAPIK